MAYYFAVETEENSFLARNIRNSKYFGAEYSTRGITYACTLGEIDGFTTEFEDEKSLKETLLREEIITLENMGQELSIFYARDIERRLVSRNILYSDSKQMLENPLEVIKYIEERANNKDYPFFRSLGETLAENTITKSLVTKIASLVESQAKGYNVPELEKNNVVTEVAKLLIFNVKTKKNGTVTCSEKINAEGLHNTIAFIRNYEKGLNKQTNYTKKIHH